MATFGNKIILASASPRRRELMERAGLDFEVHPASVEEEVQESPDDTREIAVRNALLKARAVAEEFPGRLVLGADTIVVLDGAVYGKPRDAGEAFSMLSRLRGRTHSVFTAMALVSNPGAERSSCCESRVTFKNLSDAEIRDYISKVHVLDKAGAYAVQECGGSIIEKIDGPFDNVMGLPVGLLKKELDSFPKGGTISGE